MNLLRSFKLLFIVYIFLLPAALPSCSSSLEPIQNTCEGVDCSGHGKCQIQGGKAICVCDSGYYADGLECVEGVDPCETIDCSGHGDCVLQSGEATCECESGYEPDGLSCVPLCTEDADCDDGNVCTDDSCDLAIGCVHQNNVNLCSDSNVCTLGDYCSSGECIGGPAPNCTGTGGECRADSTCDPTGTTANCDVPGTPINEGQTCNDGNNCTVDETCITGSCSGGNSVAGGTSCDDGLFCSGSDTCDGARSCVHTGDPCSGLICDELNDICRDVIWYGLGGSDYGPWLERIGTGVGETTPVGGGISNTSYGSIQPDLAVDDSGNPVVAWTEYIWDAEGIYVKQFDDSVPGGAWVEVGPGPATGEPVLRGEAPSLARSSIGNLFVTADWSGGGVLKVMKYDGENWIDLGGPEGHCRISCSVPVLGQVTDGNPVVAGVQASYIDQSDIFIAEHEGSSWTHLGDGIGSEGINYNPSLTTDKDGNPVVAWDHRWDDKNDILIMRYESGMWVEVGDGSASGGGISSTESISDSPSVAVDGNGNLIVVWAECLGRENSGFPADCQQIFIKKFDGNSWVEVGIGSASGGGINQTDGGWFPSVVIDSSGNPVVAWEDHSSGSPEIYVKGFDGQQWVEIGVGSASGGGVSNSSAGSYRPNIAIGGGRICVTWSELGLSSEQIVMRCADE